MVCIGNIPANGAASRAADTVSKGPQKVVGQARGRLDRRFHPFFILIVIALALGSGCGFIKGRSQANSMLKAANDLFDQGKYRAAQRKYEQIIEKHPTAAARAFFEMGLLYASPRSELKDYQKALICFQKVVTDFPDSEYRQNSQMMLFQIPNVINKDKQIAAQQATLETLRQTIKDKTDEIFALRDKITICEQTAFARRTAPADKILIEKKPGD